MEKIPSSFQVNNAKELELPLISKINEDSVLTEETLHEIENMFLAAGFEFAANTEVRELFNDDSLLCRNEALSNVIQQFNHGSVIEVNPDSNYANMCTMSGSRGFSTAMQEGFSEKEVNGKIKTVITFRPTHIKLSNIDKKDSLWTTKPNTAAVSKSGRGSINITDIVMISLRFPIVNFPEEIMTTEEAEKFELDEVKFIVRHYIKKETKH